MDPVNESATAPREVLEKRYTILQYFKYEHLPEKLKAVSQPFCDIAYEMAASLPYNPETSAGLRKLLEAKDCAVRAAL